MVVINPYSNPQKIKAAFSDSDSVFENEFTSPNKDGGNNDTDTTSSTKNNGEPYKFNSATTISSNIYLMSSLCFILIIFI